MKTHLENNFFPVGKYVDDTWWGFTETVLQVCSQKNSAEERWVFRQHYRWWRILALRQCYNAHGVTSALNDILFNSRQASDSGFSVNIQWDNARRKIHLSPPRVKDVVKVSFCIVIVIENLCRFIFHLWGKKSQKGLNLLRKKSKSWAPFTHVLSKKEC